MAYLLRFVQRYRPANKDEFLALEKEFALLERTTAGFPQGRRYLPYSGREPGNTLVWECEFPTLDELRQAMALLGKNETHEALYRRQVPYFIEAYTEIYECFP
jgi:hypothetical protein